MSNYPPGVSAGAYQISGPGFEFEEDREVSCSNDDCTDFEKTLEVPVEIKVYSSCEWWEWTCPTCNKIREFEVSL